MFDADTIQLNCLSDLIFIAFLECLTSGEASISLGQLNTRNFTPHQQATRDCVCFLFRQGRVVLSPIISKRHGRVVKVLDTNISVYMSPEEISKMIITLSYNMRAKIADSGCQSFLAVLDDQLEVYECIEYGRFYLEREGLTLKEDSRQSYKLNLMVMELAREQVFMLLWRAVKTAATSSHQNGEKFVTVNKLCDLAYKFFLEYRKHDAQIDFYRTPYSVGNSVLRGVISKYK